MKGIPAIHLKQLKRSATLPAVGTLVAGALVAGALVAGTLVAGASLLGATQAHAALGTQPGAVSITPGTGAVTTTGITYATTTGCPAGNQGSGLFRLVDPGGGGITNLAPVNNSVAAPFTGTFNTTFSILEQVFPDIVGATSELVMYCFSGPSATGTSVTAQDTFITISADGSMFTEGSSRVQTPLMTLTASPDPAAVGQTVTLTATVEASGATGSVQFSVGGTAIGYPVALANGVATTTTSFATPGTEALSALYTPTGSASGSSVSLNLTVHAAQPQPGVIPLSVTMPSIGAFTITVDSADTIALATNENTATATTTPIVVSDTRNTFPGWSVSAQDSEWIGSGAAAGATISGDQLGWVPASSTSPLTPGVALGGTVAPASPGLGSTPAVLAAVTEGLGNGYGMTTLRAGLNLAIPVPQTAGPYTSGLSFTGVSTTP